MKKITLIFCVFLFSFSSFAQVEVEQGSIILDLGTNGFTSESITSIEGLGVQVNDNFELENTEFDDVYDKYNTSKFQLDFKSGYCIVDGLILGIGLKYESQKTDVEYTSSNFGTDYDETQSSLAISPMIRYYFGESGFWSSLDYVIYTMEMDDSFGTYNGAEFPKTNALGFAAGYAISLNDYVALNPVLNYTLKTVTTKDGGTATDGPFNTKDVDRVQKSGSFSIGIALSVHLGY